jgi:hypothetical protein
MGTWGDTVAAALVAALVAVGVAGAVGAASRLAAVAAAQTAAVAVAQSEAAVLHDATYIAYPTTTGYATSGPGIANPDHDPVTLTVANYQAGATPAFSPSYPDSGLQAITITVTPPVGPAVTVTIYKRNPA